MEVETFLEFTVESGEEFGDGWLPTLETALRMGDGNTIEYRFYEKETCSTKTVQIRTAMDENSKHQVLANNLVRRLCNSMEGVGEEEIVRVVDSYSQKLLNSGFNMEQTRKIVVNGIRGYQGQRNRCNKEGRNLHRTAN